MKQTAGSRTMTARVLFNVIVVVGIAEATFVNQYVPGKTLVIQYGEPRTATTLQYTIAAHMAFLKNREVGLRAPSSGFKLHLKWNDVKANSVWKTHSASFRSKLKNTKLLVMLLTTATDATSKSDSAAAYIQYTEKIEDDATSVIDDYAKLFNLSSVQTELTRTYIKFWDLLRLCCGTQQSISHRLHLHGCPPIRPWYDKKRPHCEVYNLTAVEEIVIFASNGSGSRPFADPITIEDAVPSGGSSTILLGPGLPRMGIGSCAKTERAIKSGLEFNNGQFTDCPSLVKEAAKDYYLDYVCRYGYEKNEYLCNSTFKQ